MRDDGKINKTVIGNNINKIDRIFGSFTKFLPNQWFFAGTLFGNFLVKL